MVTSVASAWRRMSSCRISGRGSSKCFGVYIRAAESSVAPGGSEPLMLPARMKKIAILQPNYIPWKGVFDLISRIDVFVFYDDVQYTAKDWRSRNRIRTAHGDIWLTVPVLSKGLRTQRICDAVIDPLSNWQEKHYKALKANYQKAKYFKEYEYLL